MVCVCRELLSMLENDRVMAVSQLGAARKVHWILVVK